MNRHLYTIIQWTWGLPQTLIGSAVYLVHRKDGHFSYNGAVATAWDKQSGVSLGKFIFVPRGYSHSRPKSIYTDVATGTKVDKYLVEHEYGHTIQSLVLGPLYLLAVGLPSIVWNRHPHFEKMRQETGKSYYSIVFERTASELGMAAAAKREGVEEAVEGVENN